MEKEYYRLIRMTIESELNTKGITTMIVTYVQFQHNKLGKTLQRYFASMPWPFLTGGLLVLAMGRKIL